MAEGDQGDWGATPRAPAQPFYTLRKHPYSEPDGTALINNQWKSNPVVGCWPEASTAATIGQLLDPDVKERQRTDLSVQRPEQSNLTRPTKTTYRKIARALEDERRTYYVEMCEPEREA